MEAPAFIVKKVLGNKRLLQPIVPSSLDILSDRRPAKLPLYDPLRYGVLSSDDRYGFVENDSLEHSRDAHCNEYLAQ